MFSVVVRFVCDLLCGVVWIVLSCYHVGRVCVCLFNVCVLCDVLCDVIWAVVFYMRSCLNEGACVLCALYCMMLYALAFCALLCPCLFKAGCVC